LFRSTRMPKGLAVVRVEDFDISPENASPPQFVSDAIFYSAPYSFDREWATLKLSRDPQFSN
jgi:hypothetical protein